MIFLLPRHLPDELHRPLTPKPWRDKGEGRCVCNHVSTEGKKAHVARELEEQLRLYDELTLPENEWSELA